MNSGGWVTATRAFSRPASSPASVTLCLGAMPGSGSREQAVATINANPAMTLERFSVIMVPNAWRSAVKTRTR